MSVSEKRANCRVLKIVLVVVFVPDGWKSEWEAFCDATFRANRQTRRVGQKRENRGRERWRGKTSFDFLH